MQRLFNSFYVSHSWLCLVFGHIIVGTCHTLISSGDHPLLGCDPRLTTSRYLAPIVRQFVKFRDMPEVKGKHCSTIREVL